MFVFVALLGFILPRVRNSPWADVLLDSVNIAALGLMVGVALQLGVAALVDPLTIAMGLVSAVLLLRWRVDSTWLIFGGAVLGLARVFLH